MKKIEIPPTILKGSNKCPHNYSCLETGICEGADNCIEDHLCGENNVLFLKNIDPSTACSYRTNYDGQQACLCPTKYYLQLHRLDGDIIFKQCSKCQKIWMNYYDFLADPSLTLCGYQLPFEELETGMFLFDHSCKTTLSIPVGYFTHLYNGPIFEERATGSDECPVYCLRAEKVAPCKVKCECAYIREIMLIVKNWPKNDQSF